MLGAVLAAQLLTAPHAVAQAPAPLLSSATADGDTLTLSFDSALGAASIPAASAFTVTAGGDAFTVSGAELDGSHVVLTLTTVVTAGQTVEISYEVPSQNPLRGSNDTTVEAFERKTVVNETAPKVTSAQVVDGAVTLSYDANLDGSSTPAVGSYYVEVSLIHTSVRMASVSGDSVHLALVADVQAGQLVTVSYEPPETSPVQALGGSAAQALSFRTVTNNSAVTVPALTGASVDGAVVELAFSESIDRGSIPPPTDFRQRFEVLVGSESRQVLDAWIAPQDQSILRLLLAWPVEAHEIVSAAYTAPAEQGARRIQDLGGTAAISIAARSVTNLTSTPIPALWSAHVHGDTLVLTYSRQLDAASRPEPTDFSVTAGSPAQTFAVDTVAIDDSRVVLTLASEVATADDASVTYTPGAGRRIQDLSGSAAAALDGERAASSATPVITPARIGVENAPARLMYPAFHPDTLHYALRCSDDDSINVEVSKSAQRTKVTIAGRTAPSQEVHSHHEILGLDGQSDIVVTLADGAETASYVLHCVPYDFPVFNVLTTSEEASGLLFASNVWEGGNASSALWVHNADGVPLLHRYFATTGVRVFKPQANEATPYTYFGNPRRFSNNQLNFDILAVNDQLEVQDTLSVTDRRLGLTHLDPHDVIVRPNGNYVTMSYEPRTRDLSSFSYPFGSAFSTQQKVLDGVVTEFTPEHSVVWRWNSFDHMDFRDCIQSFPGSYKHPSPNYNIWDYVHLNNLDVMPDGDIIVTGRHCSQIYRIDAETGETEWIIGKSNSDSANMIEVVGDPYGEFCGPHSPVLLDNGNIILYDNGWKCVLDATTAKPDRINDRVSRVVEYSIDTDAKTATFVRQYSENDPDTPYSSYTTFGGLARETPDGHWLISWGGNFPNIDPNTVAMPVPSTQLIDPDTEKELFALRTAFKGYIRNGRTFLVDREFTFSTVDEGPPAALNARFHGTSVTLRFDEYVNAAPQLSSSDFTVTVNSVEATLSGDPVLSDTTVRLELSAPTAGNDIVAVSYSGTSLSDHAASPNSVAAFGPLKAVNINPAAVETASLDHGGSCLRSQCSLIQAPVGLARALTVRFDKDLDTSAMPAASSFTVTVNGTETTVSSVAPAEQVRGSSALAARSVIVSLEEGVQAGQSVRVAYTAPAANALRDSTGVAVASFGAFEVANNTPPRSPVQTSASINGSTVTLVFDEVLDEASLPADDSFSVSVTGDADRLAILVQIDASTVTLELDSQVQAGQSAALFYTAPHTDALVDIGGTAPAVVGGRLTNVTPVDEPMLSGASVDGNTLTLTYSERLDTSSRPPMRSFAVAADGSPVPVSSVLVGESKVTLVLSVATQAGQVLVVSYSPPISGAIRDVGGTNAAAFADHEASNSTAARAPELISAVINGAALTLTFDEGLDEGPPLAAASITVAVASSTAAVQTATVSGSEVQLTLTTAVQAGQSVTVAYTKPAQFPIQDIGGTEVASFPAQTVSNDTVARAPQLAGAVIVSSTVTLTYDEALDAGSAPAAASFIVTVSGDGTRTVNNVGLAGSKVTLTLNSAVEAGQSVAITYRPPHLNPIQDPGGTPAAALQNHSASNTTGAIPPTMTSAEIGGALLTLNYDEALDEGSRPAASSFSVTFDGSAITVSRVSVAETQVTLTLSTPVQAGQDVYVSYAPPSSGAIRDIGGTPASALTNQNTTNNTPVQAPLLSGATIDGAVLALAYGEALDEGSRPAASSFAVTFDGSTITVSRVSVAETQVTLTLSTPVQAGQDVYVSYAPPSSGAIRDIGGTPASALTNENTTNNTSARAPLLSSATINGDQLKLTYDERLDEASSPAAASFVVNASNRAYAVQDVSVVDAQVIISLVTPVQAGQQVTVSYAPPPDPIRDLGGTPAARLTKRRATNNTPVRAPTLRSTQIDDAEATLTYSEVLDTSSKPAAASFAVAADGRPITVNQVSITGPEVTFSLAMPVQAGQRVIVSYTPPRTRPLRDLGGTLAAGFTDREATNHSEPTAPRITAATFNGASISLNYDEPLDAGSPPAAESFKANVGGVPIAVDGVTITVSTVRLTLQTPIQSGQIVLISYDPPARNRIQDLGGTPSAALDAHQAQWVTRPQSSNLTGGGDGGGDGGGGETGDDNVGTATVVVANGWSPPDIGVAAAMSARISGAAVVYTAADLLSASASELLAEYRPMSIVIVGGAAAVTAQVKAAIERIAGNGAVSRVMGADRIETAAAAARQILGSPSGREGRPTLILANGWSPPDIGVAAALSARTSDAAVLYTTARGLSPEAAEVIRDFRPERVIIVGGTRAVSNAVQDAIGNAAPGADVLRISGATRSETAAAAARHILGDPADLAERPTLILANGWSAADIGAAAALAARTTGSAVVYTAARALPDDIAALISDYQPQRVWAIGGTAAVTDIVTTAIRELAPEASVPRAHGATRLRTSAAIARQILGRP